MRYLLLLVLGFTHLISFGQATDLIISEYVEGSSNNKYIEIYNGTAASINLANYELRLYSNGSATVSNTHVLTGTLAANTAIVYKNSAAAIYAGAATNSTVCAFNGDDAVALFKTSTSAFVDIVGNIGCDPGTAWSGTNSTLDKTLIRNASVCSGVTTDPTTVCTFPTLDSEWSQANIDVISNLGSHTMSCVVVSCTDPGEPTTLSTSLASSPTCTSATITWNTVAGNGTNHLVLVSTTAISGTPTDNTNYTASTVFGSGGSSISGAQVVYNGTGNSVTITGLAAGTTYNVAVFEFNLNIPNCTNYTTTNTGTSFITLTGCGPTNPQLLGILANSCDVQEGLNEYFVFQNGTSALSLSSMTVTYPTLGFDYCNSGCGTNTLLNNASAISALNSAAGCTLFAFADPIPASATVVVFTGNPPTAPPNFSAQCGQLYYAIFCNNPSDVSGRFANSGTGTRTLTVNFGATTDAVTYDLSAITNADGAYVSYDYSGNPTYSVLTNCAGPLAVTLTKWEGKATNEGNVLSWSTSLEVNNSHFIVKKSTDGFNFIDLEKVPSQMGATEAHYSVIDRDVKQNTTYYQLIDVDFDNVMNASPIIAVSNKQYQTEFSVINGYLVYSDWSEIKALSICDATGKVIFNNEENSILESNKISLNSGFYFIQACTKTGKIITQKLFVNGAF